MRIFKGFFSFFSVFLFLISSPVIDTANAIQDRPFDFYNFHFLNTIDALIYTLEPEDKKKLSTALQAKKLSWKTLYNLADAAESRMDDVRKECADAPLKYARWTKQLSRVNFGVGRWQKGAKLARESLSLPVITSNPDRQKETAGDILHAWSENAGFPWKQQESLKKEQIEGYEASLNFLINHIGLKPDDIEMSGMILTIYCRLGLYVEAEQFLNSQLNSLTKLPKSSVRQFYLSKRLHIELAQGKIAEADHTLAVYMTNYKNYLLTVWKNQKGSKKPPISFEGAWRVYLRAGSGPNQMFSHNSSSPRLQLRFFLARTTQVIWQNPVPLSDENKSKLSQIRTRSPYLTGDKSIKAIKDFLAEPGFQNCKTILLLRFLQIELLLLRNKGPEAWKLFQILEKDWQQLESSDDPDSKAALKVLKNSISRPSFPFRGQGGYLNYLCTFYECEEFRDLANYRQNWKDLYRAIDPNKKTPQHALDYLRTKRTKEPKHEPNQKSDKAFSPDNVHSKLPVVRSS